jgi:hypothetical protein
METMWTEIYPWFLQLQSKTKIESLLGFGIGVLIAWPLPGGSNGGSVVSGNRINPQHAFATDDSSAFVSSIETAQMLNTHSIMNVCC